jgi:hypothetical protein
MTKAQIAYDVAVRAIAAQRARLDNIRTRTGTLLAAASLVSAFLGAEALKDTTTDAKGAQVADLTLQPWEIVGIGGFVASALICLWILRPQLRTHWQFEMSVPKMISDWVDNAQETEDAMQRELALQLEDAYDHNEPSLGHLMWWFTAATIALFVEVVAWLFDLANV